MALRATVAYYSAIKAARNRHEDFFTIGRQIPTFVHMVQPNLSELLGTQLENA